MTYSFEVFDVRHEVAVDVNVDDLEAEVVGGLLVRRVDRDWRNHVRTLDVRKQFRCSVSVRLHRHQNALRASGRHRTDHVTVAMQHR